MFNIFKKKIKTILPSTQQSNSKQTIKIKPQFAFLSELQKCLQKGCLLSHLSFIDQQQLEMLANAAKQLMNISESLKLQQLQNNDMKTFYENNRHIVSNHTSIVKGIQTMYEERIKIVRDDFFKIIEQKDQLIKINKEHIDSLTQQHKILKQQHQQIKKVYLQEKQKIKLITIQKQQLQNQVQTLRKEINLYSSVTANSSIKLNTLNSKDTIALILRSQVSSNILNYLSISDILNFSTVNKMAQYIGINSVSFNKFIMKKSFQETQKWRINITKQVRYFQSMVQNINDDSVRQSALKYIYFHQKPGEYILQTLKQFNSDEQKQEPKKRKNSTSIFERFLDKQKKQEGKINLKQLADPQYFKKVQSKINEYFHNIIDINANSSLKGFRQVMLEQYQDMRKIILNQNQIIKLYHCSKFLYLQSQQLHRFCQYLFSLFVQISKKYQNTKSQFQDMVQKQQSIKNVLHIINTQKTKTQQQNWLLELDLKKQKLSSQSLQKKVNETQKQIQTLKDTYEKLKSHDAAVNKKNQQLSKKVNKLQKYLEQIKTLFS